jgi:iron-sulfur cluster insertion protein
MQSVEVETAPRTATPGGSIPLAPNPISLTEKAAEMVRDAMEQEGLEGHGLRIGVIGGGCSGLQYLLDFSEKSVELDFVDEQHGIQIFVDPFSAAHLQGTVINYVDGLHGSGFKFENPNIVRACGCGQSFST